MTEYLLDVDPVARAWNTFELDGETVIIRRYWESDGVDAVLDHNARVRLDAPTQHPDIRHVASIPDIVLYQWLQQGIDLNDPNDQKKINALLSSSEYYKLRTGGGRL